MATVMRMVIVNWSRNPDKISSVENTTRTVLVYTKHGKKAGTVIVNKEGRIGEDGKERGDRKGKAPE